MNSVRCDISGALVSPKGWRRQRKLLWHGLAREARVDGDDQVSRVPRPVDDEVTLQLLRTPDLEGPLSISDAVVALRRAEALLRNVPFMRDQRLVLLRWSEAWLQVGLGRLEELARNRQSEESRDRLDQARRSAGVAHRDVLDLIQQAEAGQVFELVGFARYNLCRSVALARDQERQDLEPCTAPCEW
jgi:hypothetical protein